MAGGYALTTSSNETKKLYNEKLHRDVVKQAFFPKFSGTGPNNIVEVKTDLSKGSGDQIYFYIRMRLTGAGVTGDNTLEGNEEDMTTYRASVSLEQYRHATKIAGKMTEQRSVINLPTEARQSILDWGSEKVDDLHWTALTTGTPSKIFYGGTASSTANITATDLITPALISKVKAWSLTGGDRDHVPLRPVMVNGSKRFVLPVHPTVMYDIKTNTVWTQAVREAEIRGKDNPLFADIDVALWDGVLVVSSERVPTVTNWGAGSNVYGAKLSLLGAQSLCTAYGQREELVVETKDYKNQTGYGWGIQMGVVRPTFNSKDYGSVAVYVARTNI